MVRCVFLAIDGGCFVRLRVTVASSLINESTSGSNRVATSPSPVTAIVLKKTVRYA